MFVSQILTRNSEENGEVNWDMFSTAMLSLDMDLLREVNSKRKEGNLMIENFFSMLNIRNIQEFGR